MFNTNFRLHVFKSWLILLLPFNLLFSQIQFKNGPESKITVKGTSTLHDWSMESQKFDCNVYLSQASWEGAIVDRISFSLQVDNLKSDKAALDKNAYKALKTNEIQFHSTLLDTLQFSANQVKGNIVGDLTIAGTTRPVSFPFEGKIQNETTMESTAICKINMKDFGVKPPSFMLGAMKTGAEVEIIIHMQLQSI